MGQIRINGLVAASDRIRSVLQAGIAPTDVEPFKQRVQELIQQVADICRQSGGTPDDLPTPSWNAYQSLKEINLNDLPIHNIARPAPAPGTLGIQNVVRIGDQVAAKMWRDVSINHGRSALIAGLRTELDRHISSIEGICTQHNATPAALKKPSRQVYCWMKFLLSEAHLAAHLTALERANAVVDEHWSSHEPPLEVQLVNINAVWRRRAYRNVVFLKCSEGFIFADSNVWRVLVERIRANHSQTKTHPIDEFVASEDFSAVLFDMESFASPPAQSTQGRTHNLDKSFDRVNAEYFDGKMAKPKLHWNEVLTVRKFGHYQFSRDTVMLSISLDDPKGPAFVVDFVMYHELLHKKHGIKLVNGRRMVHTPAFRADERKYARYDEAQAYLNTLAAGG